MKNKDLRASSVWFQIVCALNNIEFVHVLIQVETLCNFMLAKQFHYKCVLRFTLLLCNQWVPEDKPGFKGGSAVRLEGNQQFAPQGADPKELRAKHQAIRKEYYEEKIDAGPQSRILEGITWDEAQKMKVS